MNIFFDFDGTLLESRPRVFNLFNSLSGNTIISYDEYWQLKRNMFSNEWILTHILRQSNEDISNFKNEWFNLIESEEFLEYDRIFNFTIPTLEKIENNKLYIVTSRMLVEPLNKQVESFGLKKYFNDVLVSRNQISKKDLISGTGLKLSANDIIIGDTEADIIAARELNIRSFSVLSGFRSYEVLSQYKPNKIFINISETISELQ